MGLDATTALGAVRLQPRLMSMTNEAAADCALAGQGITRLPLYQIAKPVQDGTYIYHVVQPGDTLWDIAKRYPGVSVDDLKRLNGGAVQDGLKVGDRIKVGVQEG
jgi:LysM repeat protein